jgi:hypothetical protein
MLGALAAFLFFSCDQYPIFYAISQEVEPKEPRVKGGPTAMIELDGTMYVASRFGKTIHYYDKAGAWNRISSPNGNIMDLAADGKYLYALYALTGDPLGETKVYYRKEDASWEPISDGVDGAVQTICGAGGVNGGYIFASTAKGLFVYKTDENSFSSLLPDIPKENKVTGAALLESTYYVAVVNKGIYTFDGSALSAAPVTGTEGKPIVGMLAAGDKIVAVSRESGSGSGSLFYGDSSGFAEAQKSVAFSGAMTLWSANKTPASASDLLLVGIQAPSYSTVNGYREITLNNGNLATAPLGLGTPGESGVSTVSSTDSYVSTIGLRIVTALYQAADNTIFASTTTRGLWSYRNDVWNAED